MEQPLLFESRNRPHHCTREPALLIYHKSPDSFQKPRHPFYTPRTPGLYGLQWAHEHFIEPYRIGSEVIHHLVGIDHVAAGFRHLLVVFSQYNPLMDQLLERFRRTDHSNVIENLVP